MGRSAGRLQNFEVADAVADAMSAMAEDGGTELGEGFKVLVSELNPNQVLLRVNGQFFRVTVTQYRKSAHLRRTDRRR